jgi:hypothetical protein
MKLLLFALFLGMVIATRNSSAQLPDGPCIILHRNGVTYQAWKYPNGKTRCVRTIDQRGVANGVEYRWREDGSMSAILSNINGQPVFLVQLDEGGKCRAIEAHPSGKQEGPSISFYPSGLVKSYEPNYPKVGESVDITPFSSPTNTTSSAPKTTLNPPPIIVMDADVSL